MSVWCAFNQLCLHFRWTYELASYALWLRARGIQIQRARYRSLKPDFKKHLPRRIVRTKYRLSKGPPTFFWRLVSSVPSVHSCRTVTSHIFSSPTVLSFILKGLLIFFTCTNCVHLIMLEKWLKKSVERVRKNKEVGRSKKGRSMVTVAAARNRHLQHNVHRLLLVPLPQNGQKKKEKANTFFLSALVIFYFNLVGSWFCLNKY